MAAAVWVWPSDTFPVPSVCGTQRRRESPWAPGEKECVRVSKCVCEAASLCRLNVYSASPSLSLNNSALFMHTHTHTLCHPSVLPRVCCQPLLLICTRRAGKKTPNLSLLPFSFLHYDLSSSFPAVSLTLIFLSILSLSSFFCFIFLHIFHPLFLFLPAIWLFLSLSLSCISKWEAGKHVLLLLPLSF